MKGAHRFLYLIGLIACLLILVFFPKWTVDDAYISYRYAQNFLTQGEMTWNVGETPIEGYTGIFLPLLAAGIMAIGLEVVSTIQILGVLALALLLLFQELSLRKLGVRPLFRSIAFLFMALVPLLYLHALSGLETIFFLALFSGLIYLYLCLISDEIKYYQSVVLGIGLTLLGLMRPEGILFSGIVLGALLYLSRRNKNRELFKVSLISGLIF